MPVSDNCSRSARHSLIPLLRVSPVRATRYSHLRHSAFLCLSAMSFATPRSSCSAFPGPTGPISPATHLNGRYSSRTLFPHSTPWIPSRSCYVLPATRLNERYFDRHAVPAINALHFLVVPVLFRLPGLLLPAADPRSVHIPPYPM